MTRKQSDQNYQLNLEKEENSLFQRLAASNGTANKISVFNRLGKLFSDNNIDKAIEYFEEAAKLDSTEDEFNCGYFLFQKYLALESEKTGSGKKYRERAKHYYKKAAEKDYKKAIYSYYKLCSEEDEGEEEEARYFIRKNADNGNVNSMIFIAKLFENKKSTNNSLKYYKMAADKCKKNEAMIYANKIAKSNLKEAIIYYKISVSKGSIKACFSLAKIFKVNNQINNAIEYYKTAILLLERKKTDQNFKDKDNEYYIKARYKIGKLYYNKYQKQAETDRDSALQFLQLAEFYLMQIFQESSKASQILFSIIELQKDELSHQEYIKLMNSLGKKGVSSAVQIYFNETNDFEYIKEAIKTNSDDSFTNYIYGTHENNIEHIKKAANLGSPEASYDYAIYLYSQLDQNDPSQILDKAFQLLNFAYENGVTKAAAILGILYHNNWINNGQDEAENEEKALELLENVKKDDERAMLLVNEIKSKQIQRRNSSKYSVFI